MTIQPGESREQTAGQHHQARDTQELMEATEQAGQHQDQRQDQRLDVQTDEFPAAPEFHDDDRQAHDEPGLAGTDPSDAAGRPRQDFADQPGLDGAQQGFADQEILVEPGTDHGMRQDMGGPDPDAQELRDEQQVQGAPATTSSSDEHVALFDHGEADGLRTQWRDIQSEFVDDPQHAVQLVAQVIQSLTASFAAHKQELDSQWQRGDSVATEDLRLALRRYRTLFNQLLDA
jgi:hypothetical protein